MERYIPNMRPSLHDTMVSFQVTLNSMRKREINDKIINSLNRETGDDWLRLMNNQTLIDLNHGIPGN